MTRLIDHVLLAKQDELEPLGGLLAIHDWRALKSYRTRARAIFMQRVRTHKRYVREAVVAINVTRLFLRPCDRGRQHVSGARHRSQRASGDRGCSGLIGAPEAREARRRRISRSIALASYRIACASRCRAATHQRAFV